MSNSSDPTMAADGGTPDADGRPEQPPARRPRRGWFAPVFWLLVCAAIVALAVRSFRHSDVLAVYGRSGAIQGVESHRGRVLVAASNLSFGSEKGLTADAASVTTAEGERLYEQVYKQWPNRRERFGFGFATSKRGDLVVADATHAAAVVPHWLLAALAGLPAVRWLRGTIRLARRRRQGRCLGCGYDLRGSAGVCPECGTAATPPVLAPAGLPRGRG